MILINISIKIKNFYHIIIILKGTIEDQWFYKHQKLVVKSHPLSSIPLVFQSFKDLKILNFV